MRGEAADSSTRDHWRELAEELDRWRAEGMTARFWWRDDDAGTVTPALERLLDLSAAEGVPLGLAVIPLNADEALAGKLADYPLVAVLQHGIAHVSHAEPGALRTELGGTRATETVAAALADARQRSSDLFGGRLLPVLVPPWNEISDPVVRRLPGLGYSGLSTFGQRQRRADGLVESNAHIQPIEWRGRRYAGDAVAVEHAIAELKRRRDIVDRDEPIGLLTHHWAMDEATWGFVLRFIAATKSHPAAAWIAPAQAFF